jgi:hypothetical protein
MSKQIESNPSRVSFDPGAVDMDKLDDIADERDLSRAELIRQTLKEVVEAHDDGEERNAELHKPEHPELLAAFETLLDASDHPRGVRRVGVEEARDKLHTQQCGKSQVVERLLSPLNQEGFITIRNGQITVHRQTVEEVEAARQQTEREIEEQGYDGPIPSQHDTPDEQKTIRKYQHGQMNVPFGAAAWAASQVVWDDGDRVATDGGQR